MTPDWPWAEWTRTLEEASLRFGKPLRIAGKMKRWYREAGFEDVHEEIFKVPVNPWPKDPRMKDLGKMCELNLLDGVQGFSLALLHRGLGWTKNEIEVGPSPPCYVGHDELKLLDRCTSSTPERPFEIETFTLITNCTSSGAASRRTLRLERASASCCWHGTE